MTEEQEKVLLQRINTSPDHFLTFDLEDLGQCTYFKEEAIDILKSYLNPKHKSTVIEGALYGLHGLNEHRVILDFAQKSTNPNLIRIAMGLIE